MVKHAIILARGKGEPFRPLTDKVQKPMIDVLGRPLVEYQVLLLKSQGVEHIVFSCGYKSEVIKDYFKDGSKWGLKIEYVVEDEPLGRGGAFKNALKLITQDVELIYGSNGEEVIAESLEPMIKLHQDNSAMATIFMIHLISPFGIVEIDDSGKVTAFREKPTLPNWINAGVYLFDRKCIELFPDKGDHEDFIFPDLVSKGRIFGYQGSYRGTVNNLRELDVLKAELPSHFPRELLKDAKVY